MQAIVWSAPGCSWCEKAKTLLKQKDIPYVEKVLGSGYEKKDLLEAVPGARSIPQIFLNDEYIGGYDKLEERLRG